MGTVAPALSLAAITKSYGPVRALDGVSLDLRAGEVVGITGDNGAGKSTLLKVVAGAHAPDSGTIRVDGQVVRFRSPADARRHGIEIVYQELALAPHLDVVKNVYLGRELTRRLPGLRDLFLDRATMRVTVESLLEELGVGAIDVTRPVADFSGGQRQAIAIARALTRRPSVIVMDEPTAALSAAKVPFVLDLVGRLRDRGVAVAMVSHRIQDLLRVSDRIVVIGRGLVALDRPAAEVTQDAIVDAMAPTEAVGDG